MYVRQPCWSNIQGFVMGVYPIEGRLRLPAVKLMYEVCRVQKLDEDELAQFDDSFIDHLFDLVESTRNQQDEALNYAVIKLIVALNEQFMVHTLPKRESRHRGVSASATALSSEGQNDDSKRRRAHSVSPAPKSDEHLVEDTKRHNRVLVVLMRRLGNSPTFASSVVFMLNRAEDTPEGLCLQLLILKIIYLLFTTPGTREYFYTNDLRVLLDVFIRELVDLDDEHDALRHTYLRVLYPLLCHSQLRNDSYKRPQIRLVLHSLVSQSHLREVDSTMKRLVDRCLTAAKDYCPVKEPRPSRNGDSLSPVSAMCLDSVAAALPGRSLYTGGDPARVASLIDVSDALEQPDRPPSAASTSADSPIDRSASCTPLGKHKPLHRRRAPAPPPKRKLSATSTNSAISFNSEDGDGILTGPPSVDLVTIGERRVPPPIIEVQPCAPPEWIKFST